MEAIEGLLLDQCPPGLASDKLAVEPRQIFTDPPIGAGKGFTVNSLVVKQPEPIVYVINTLPEETPVTRPDEEPIEARAGLLVDHMPPPGSLSTVVCP
jgi:hypothetical protein